MNRYINADDVLREASKRFDYLDDFEEVLDAVPTADVRKNVKGKWFDSGKAWGKNWFTCSACGLLQGDKTFSFCPNCGADMRKETEEEKVCGNCKYFQYIPTTSYPLIGRGECINPKGKHCYKSTWSDSCACEEFIEDMRGDKE